MTQPTFSGALDSSGALDYSGSTAPVSGAQDTTQAEMAANLAQLAQQQGAANAPEPSQKDKSKGWSWTNPLQDIGQVWHDVETHTVAPMFHAAHWLYSYGVARPISTLMLYSARESGDGNYSPFQGSAWKDSWDQSSSISPGQALVLAINDSPASPIIAPNYNPGEEALGKGNRYIDPTNADQVQQFQTWAQNSWGGKISTGSADAAIGWEMDPTAHITKGIKVLRGVKQAPITRFDNEAQTAAKLNAPASKRFDDWAIGKNIGQIAEHPIVKGTGTTLNPYRYQIAALMAGAKDSSEINLIRQIAAGLHTRALTMMSGEVLPADKALDKLGQNSPDVANQVGNLISPMESMDKWALTPMSADEREQWLQKVSQQRAKVAQDMINADPERAQQLLNLHGTMRAQTTTSNLVNRMSEIKGNLKYANTRNTDGVSFLQKAYYNLPVRIYQGLTDRVEGLINHKDDQAVEYARAWLNKSSVLSAQDKVDYLQRYALATPAQRQRTWTDIENEVYNKVGDRYGIDSDQMQRILTATRAAGNNFFMKNAPSKAYGLVKLALDEEHAALPEVADQVILHPKLITQIEAGAVPMANLRTLENALEAMDRNGVMGTIRNAGDQAKDLLYGTLESVYGIWKPMSLITGHRAFNHIGDDWLRGAAKLGGMATAQNAQAGLANFLRNVQSRVSFNRVIRNTEAKHELAVAQAKADHDTLVAQKKMQDPNTPDDLKITKEQVAAKKKAWQDLAALKTDYIRPQYRIGSGTFKIAGTNIDWPEAFGGPNSDWARIWTSSHPTWGSLVDDAAHRTHSIMTAIRTRNFGTIRAVDDVAKHTRAYVHYVRNQLLPDPIGKMIARGDDLDSVSRWLTNTAAGRAHMKALHIGDPDDHVAAVASMVKTYLPYDGMRDEAVAGKFSADTITKYMPNAGTRPDVHANINLLIHGGDPTVGMYKRTVENFMKWTGTLPDDIMVRHPVFNSLYKSRLDDSVQSFMAKNGSKITPDMAQILIKNSMAGARKDLQGLLYDVSRFNDMGHTLRFVSPFFNAWFNAMSSWSKLFMENPTLLSRTYQAKRLMWNAPIPLVNQINTDTGQRADVNTPWDKTAFVVHMPSALSGALGGLTTIPIDAKTLISPTYLDSVGNPGFGPVVAIPANQLVKDHPSLMNDAVVRSMLNNMVDQNSVSQIMPSGMRDARDILQLLVGDPNGVQAYSNTVWSIYQEQQHDYLNGQRSAPPNWSDVQNQAKYLTVVDLLANRLMPLGFKPAPAHSDLITQYRQMQQQDPKNARQNFYDKYGPAGMVFTQSLSTDPSGIAATVGASQAVKRYSDLLAKFPELGAVIVGPEGNGNFDQMAYDWQVANGLRKKLTPQEAADQAAINTGWAQYGNMRAGVLAQMQAAGIPSLNSPGAQPYKAQITNWVSTAGDRNSGMATKQGDYPGYNPQWYANYTSFNQNAYQNRITALLTIAQDKTLLANATRSDIRSLQAYSQLRDEIIAQLQARPAKSLKASSNYDLAKQFDDTVSQMIDDDSKFAQLYDRYLSKDDLSEPS